MPTRRRQPIPVTFPGLDEPLRSQLERFARTVDEQVAANLRDDVRPLEGSSEPLGAGGVYTLDPGTSPVDRELPALEFEDAGASITFIRRDVGTAVFRAPGTATVSGKREFFLPPRLGTYQMLWDGSDWSLYNPTPPLRYEFAADQLRGGPFPASASVSGSATLLADPVTTGLNVRGFNPQDGVMREFFVPTGAMSSMTLRTYFRAQSGPPATAVVGRMLRARQLADGSGVPSGWNVHTLPTVTMPSGSSASWRYQEDRIPVGALGFTGGRVQVVFSRGAAQPNELASMLLIESLTFELEG